VRLGFAVAAFLDPEILVVDEVLAVGDAEFQKKAIGKMQDVSKGEGRTVLFVSHNMDAVRRLCKKGVILKDGAMNYAGNIKNVIDVYLSEKQNASTKILNKSIAENIFLEEVAIFNEEGIKSHQILIGEKWSVKLKFQIKDKVKDIVFGIGITTLTDISINTTWSSPQSLTNGIYEIVFECDEIFFQKGTFRILLGISHGNTSIYYDDDLLQFDVLFITKEINENLIKIDGTTGIILNQLKTKIISY